MTNTSTDLARADITVVESCHDLYRVWEIPGYRDSDYYDGSGIVKTYNLVDTDLDYPPDENACPVLEKVQVGNATQEINLKNVTHLTITCPECDIEGRKTHSGESFCPECGLLLSRTDARDVDHHDPLGVNGQPLSRSANDAGRFQGEGD